MNGSFSAVSFKGFIETSFVDWPGRVAAVVFLPGCNYRCGWCHNRDLVERPETFGDIPVGHVLERLTQLKAWVDGVVITGGEPTIRPDLDAIVRRFAEDGFAIKLDTNGSHPEIIESLLKQGFLEGVSMDIKSRLDPESYARATGVRADVEAVKRSIRLILASAGWYEFRTTVVPELHTPDDIAAIRAFLQQEAGPAGLKRPLKLQAFKPSETMPEPYRSMPAMDLDGWETGRNIEQGTGNEEGRK